jgi:hypothetical protein
MTISSATPTVATPARLRSLGLLRPALQLDAVVTGLNGAAYLAAAPVLTDVLGLPAGPLRAVGAFLLAYAAAVWLVGTRPRIDPRAAGAVVAVNVVWALDSVAVAALGWGSPTVAGTVWILLQAGVVGGFAALQWQGLRTRTR